MPSKKSSVKIHKAPAGGKLLDERAVPPKADAVSRIALAVIGIGVLIGGMALGYFLYFYSPAATLDAPQIIVPNVEEEQAAENENRQAERAAQPVVVKQQVEVQATPTGYLNVRKGPGTSFAKIGQVKPGENYELVSQNLGNGGWYEIRTGDATTGWVSGQYAKIK